MTDPEKQSSPEAAQENLGAEAQQLLHSAELLVDGYKQKCSAHLNLASKEWKLTKQSVSMLLMLTLFMSAVLSSLWIVCNVALGSVLYQLGWPIYALSLSLIVVNLILLFVLWTTINALANKVGFSRSIAALLN